MPSTKDLEHVSHRDGRIGVDSCNNCQLLCQLATWILIQHSILFFYERPHLIRFDTSDRKLLAQICSSQANAAFAGVSRCQIRGVAGLGLGLPVEMTAWKLFSCIVKSSIRDLTSSSAMSLYY